MRRLLMIMALAALAACSKDKNPDTPMKLAPFTAQLKIDKVWEAKVGGTSVPLRLGLALAVQGERVFAAGEKGEIAAFDVQTGRRLWRTRTKLPLGGAVGLSGDRLIIGTTDGDVLYVDAGDGKVLWKVNVGSEILAAPALSPKLALVRTVDGKLHALQTTNGHELWQQQQPVPKLSLRGTGSPVLVGDVAVSGFDNGKVMAVNLADGSAAWETQVQIPTGKTEIERLSDIDGTALVSGNDVYVAGFQGQVAMLALDNGQIWWSHQMSSYRGLAMDDDALYVSTAEGEVVALNRRTGTQIWRQKALGHRRLSGPAVAGNAVVVADYQGYVHWLDRSTGAIIGRTRAGKSRYTNPPVAADGLVLLINDRGQIRAYRTTPIAMAAVQRARATKTGS
ncbi:MAG TPA: outer membrane protein assembly factor BamB [Steroidobacteraceae bacterium]|nr:outer membrane protein assembly factor BamB [Steroidobacteraceae bacterium]